MSSFHRAGGGGGGANHYSTASCTAATNGTDSIMGKTRAAHHECWWPTSSRELNCWLWLLRKTLTALAGNVSIGLWGCSLTQLQWDALTDLKSDVGLINREAFYTSQSCEVQTADVDLAQRCYLTDDLDLTLSYLTFSSTETWLSSNQNPQSVKRGSLPLRFNSWLPIRALLPPTSSSFW